MASSRGPATIRVRMQVLDHRYQLLGVAGQGGAGAGNNHGTESVRASGCQDEAPSGQLVWTADGEAELKKIPFFVRGKVRRNAESYARTVGCKEISSETLYDAKAHFKA